MPPPRTASRSALFGWIMFDWAAQPYFTLITTFVYAPYFAAAIASDPAEGQALWGFAKSAAGLTIAVFSPILGAIADAAGPRKPWIAGFGALLVVGACALWFGVPGGGVTLVLVAFALAAVGAEFATVFNNAMMPHLVPPERLGRLSGTGWAVGYLGGMVSLVVVLGFLAASPQTGKTLLGLAPLFGLDAVSREGDRAAGPLTAIWFAVFILPMFLFTPDHPGKLPMRTAIRQGLATLAATLRDLRRHRDAALFLLANMIYADGLVALFAFGGIYAAGTFGWGTIEIGVFGILLTLTGTIGAFVGGRLDDRLGAKRVILGSLVILTCASTAILSIDPDRIGFVVPVAPPVPGGGLYASAAERAYVAIGLLIGLAAGPMQAASRTQLVRLAPAGQETQFFGLFALSGRVTSFLGPFLVGVVTAATLSQKAGMAVLIAFFITGAVVLACVRTSPLSSRPSA
ncbi:MAG: MFS transporter [Rhizobiales bacterium]|nr:MFS transporter [Hyphomicrobiales bacterium]